MNLVASTLNDLLEIEYGSEFANSLYDTIKSAAQDAENAFLEVTNDEKKYDLFYVTYLDQEMEDYIYELCNNLADIKKTLTPFEYVKTPYKTV